MKQIHTSRGETMHSIMRHPSSAKLVKDALASPLGSSSRDKAQKLFSIMEKLHGANSDMPDGMGGPGMMYERQGQIAAPEMDPVHIPTDNSKGMVIFHKIPTPKINYGGAQPEQAMAMRFKPRVQSFDGSGGPGIKSSGAASFVSPGYRFDGKGGPGGPYDGAGGFWSDLGSGDWGAAANDFNNTISTLWGGNKAEAASVPIPPPSPSYSSTTKDFMTAPQTSGQPAVTADPRLTPSYLSDAPKLPYQEGFFGRAANWLGQKEQQGERGLAKVGAGLEGGIEYLGGNAAAGIGNFWNSLGGYQPTYENPNGPAPIKGLDWKDTWGAKQLEALNAPDTGYEPRQFYETEDEANTRQQQARAAIAQQQQVQGPQPQPQGEKPAVSSDAYGLPAGQTPPPYDPNWQSKQAPQTDADKLAWMKANIDANGNIIPGSSADKTGTKTQAEATSGAGSAAKNYSSSLGTDVTTPLSTIAQTKTQDEIFNAIVKNEGSSLAGVSNNPGNIKFAGLPGQINSGVSNDGGKSTFASYATPEAGKAAVMSIFNNAAAGTSSIYGANPTLQSFANTYTNTGPGGASTSGTQPDTSVMGAVKSGIALSKGAGMTAMDQMMNPNDPITQGKLLAARLAENEAKVRDEYNIDKLREQKYAAEQEQLNLPKDAAAYIRDRETFVKDTDKSIEAYRKQMETMDMSNPSNQATANAHLDYLYALRGRQNQTYMGYINTAVDQHQKVVDHITHDYDTNLALAERKIQSTDAIYTGEYNMYAAGLADMYKEIQDAPTRLANLQYLQAKALEASTLTPADTVKTEFVAQNKELEGHIWMTAKDNTGGTYQFPKPGIDLVNTINEFRATAPSVHPSNIIKSYSDSVNNYLSSPNDPNANTTNPGTGVTAGGKTKLAEEAIKQWANFAMYAYNQGNADSVNMGYTKANEMIQYLANVKGGELINSAPAWREAVKTLAPTGFFGGAQQPPTKAEFIATVAKLTNSTYNDALAGTVYDNFKTIVDANNNVPSAPAAAVDAMMNKVSSTTSHSTPFTDDEFAKNIAKIYADGLYPKVFAQIGK